MAQVKVLLCIVTLPILLAGGKILDGVHLKVVPIPGIGTVNISVDSQGVVIKEEGRAVEALKWLSRHLGFTYSYVNSSQWPKIYVDTASDGRGALSFIKRREADLILAGILMTEERLKEVDMFYPIAVSSFSLLIPSVVSTTDVAGPWRPFQLSVWLLLAVVIFTIPFILYGLALILKRIPKYRNRKSEFYFKSLDPGIGYVLEVLFSQGGVCYPKKLAFRLATGVWCLAAFVLVNSYCCTLTSFVTSPNYKPLIESIYDLPNRPGVHAVLEEGKAADQIFHSNKSGILKYVADDLNNNPNSRCQKIPKCIRQTKSGSYVYIVPTDLVLHHLKNDFKSTGQCNLAIAKDNFMNNILYSFALAKDSVYTDAFNNRIISLWETGLLKQWQCRRFSNIRCTPSPSSFL